MSAKSYTVGEVARLARVTVRTLHHYDEIGLLVPAARGRNGYRRYGEAELRRLHQILLFRELGFPLPEVQRILDDPSFDRRTALREQRTRLLSQVRRTEAVIRAVDNALRAMEGGTEMGTDEMFEGFEEFDHAKHADEARERWGHTEAYRESARRTKHYTKEDWARIREESDALMDALAELLASGASPEDDEAVELAERHRQHIDRWFYPCAPSMHAALADMYLADPRFRATFERHAEGLTEFLATAIRANAERAGS